MSWIELVAQRRPPKLPQGVSPPENAKDWFSVSNSADDPEATDVLVYDSIGGFFGMWAEDMVAALKEITTSKINLRLNSPGGSVFEGVTIANALRAHPANVTVYVDGIAASIASVIALAGDRLVMMPQSQMMVHNASGACYGDSSEMTEMAKLLDKQSLNIARAYAEHTGRPLAEWQQYMADETWFSAEEAVAVGLADEAMPMKPKKTPPPDEEETVSARMGRTWDLSMYAYAGRDDAPAPQITAKAPAEIKGTSLGFEVFAQYMDQMTALIKSAVREEVTEILNGAVGSHSTSTKEGEWDAGANEKRLPSPVPVATVRKMYGWFDSSAAEEGGIPKSACKLPHHFVSADGTPGAASMNGVRNALARLPQTQGLSDAERATVEAHLRAHLRAGGGGDSEDHLHEDPLAEADEVQTDDSPPAPLNATHPSMPPDEEEEEEEEEEEMPPDEEEEPRNKAGEHDVFAGLFHDPTSSGADDVFAHLKEGW